MQPRWTSASSTSFTSSAPIRRCGLLLGLLVAMVAGCGGFAAVSPISIARATGPGPCRPAQYAPAPTGGKIALDRAAGPVGMLLTLSGSGWKPGEDIVIHADIRDAKSGRYRRLLPDLAHSTARADGSIQSIAFPAPDGECLDEQTNVLTIGNAGTDIYFVAVSASGKVSAPVRFRYVPEPQIRLAPEALNGAPVGASITVAGTDWEPGVTVDISLRQSHEGIPGGDPLPGAATIQAATDAHGAFMASYPISRELSWRVDTLLDVTGTGPRYGTMTQAIPFMVLPAVRPTFTVAQRYATPGMEVTVSGDHWNPGQQVVVAYCRDGRHNNDGLGWPHCIHGSQQPIGTVTADAHGHIQQRLRLPANARTGVITVEPADLYLPVDYSVPGVAVTIVDQLPTWETIHPRLALLRTVALIAAVPVLLAAALVVLWLRRSRSQTRARAV